MGAQVGLGLEEAGRGCERRGGRLQIHVAAAHVAAAVARAG
jgi:hypothetical protein